jgi:hypothetical protein
MKLASGELHAPAALYPWKEPSVPMGEKAGWATDTVCALWKKENLMPVPGIEPRFIVIRYTG